ncbi:MAG: LCP family protein [Nocardioidaceae bacterium]
MADRPPTAPGNSPDEGAPEYNWLYGSGGGAPTPNDATRPVQREPRPDETRMMPTQPRGPQAAAASRPTPPIPQPVAAPPSPRGTSYRSRGGWRPRFRFRYLFALLLLWIVFLVAVPFFAWTKVDKVDFEPDGDRPGDQPGTTYLMVGSDSRGDLSAEEREELGTGNASGQRTDTILVLHTGSGPNVLMSIPRDSIVEVPGQGTTKINAAYAIGGAQLLTRTIENETGIRIDQYVEIGFGGFVDLVDAVDGIEICPKEAMKDPQANLDIEKGCQEADGVTALGYARSRKTYAQLGDIQRAQAQREVVSAIGRKVASPWSVINPVRYWRLNMAATRAVSFGEGASPVRAGLWASAMTNVTGDGGYTCGVPIRDLAVNWDEERSQELFKRIIEDDTEDLGRQLCSPSGLLAP